MSRFASILDLPGKHRQQAEQKLAARTVRGRDVADAPVGKSPEQTVRARNKYNARKQEVFVRGKPYRFDSKREYESFMRLAAREQAGEIEQLEVHVKFALADPGEECRGRHFGTYTCDFTYKENGKRVVVDAKGAATKARREWKRTKQLMKACWGHDVIEL